VGLKEDKKEIEIPKGDEHSFGKRNGHDSLWKNTGASGRQIGTQRKSLSSSIAKKMGN